MYISSLADDREFITQLGEKFIDKDKIIIWGIFMVISWVCSSLIFFKNRPNNYAYVLQVALCFFATYEYSCTNEFNILNPKFNKT